MRFPFKGLALIFMCGASLGLGQELLPDKIIFKEVKEKPRWVTGLELACEVVEETPDSLKVDKSKIKGIKDIVVIDRRSVERVLRGDPGERRYREILEKAALPKNSKEKEYYEEIQRLYLEPFERSFPKSRYVSDVRKILEEMQSELAKVKEGHVRRGKEWFTAAQWKEIAVNFEPELWREELAQVIREKSSGGMVELLRRIPDNHPSQFYPEAVKEILIAAEDFQQEMNRLAVNTKATLSQREEAAATQEEAAEIQEQKALVEKIIASQAGFVSELNRVRGISMEVKNKALLAIRRAAEGEPEKRVKEAMEDLKEAAGLWPECIAVWKQSRQLAQMEIRLAGAELTSDQLDESLKRLELSRRLLGVSSFAPEQMKKVDGELEVWLAAIRGVNSKLDGVASGKRWEKMEEVVGAALKELPPARSPEIKELAAAVKEWAEKRKKAARDKMESSVALTKQFDVVMAKGDPGEARELVRKAAELWPENPDLRLMPELVRLKAEKTDVMAQAGKCLELFTSSMEEKNWVEAKGHLDAAKNIYASHPQYAAAEKRYEAEMGKMEASAKELALKQEQLKREAQAQAEQQKSQAESRRRLWWMGGGLGAFLVILLGGWWWWKSRRASLE